MPRKDPLKHKFQMQRWMAVNRRNIDWKLTYEEWLDIWGDKVIQRGRGKGKFVMARYNDTGPYCVGNVYIQEHSENSKDAHKWNSRVDQTWFGGVTIKDPLGNILSFPNLKTASRQLNLSYDILWQRKHKKQSYKGYEFL